MKRIKAKLVHFLKWLEKEWEKGAEIQRRYEEALENQNKHRWYAVRGEL